MASPVVRGRVEDVDAMGESRVNPADRLLVVHLAPTCLTGVEFPRTADGPTPHAKRADFDTAPTQCSPHARERNGDGDFGRTGTNAPSELLRGSDPGLTPRPRRGRSLLASRHLPGGVELLTGSDPGLTPPLPCAKEFGQVLA